MTDKLSADRVRDVMMSCLFKPEDLPGDGSTPADAITVQGIVRGFGFDPKRVEAAKPAIAEMLDQLPNEFRADGGGGWSFLNACTDKTGELWTGMQQSVDELVCLGIAAGYAEYLLPRDMWAVLPGGVPYFSVKTPALAKATA